MILKQSENEGEWDIKSDAIVFLISSTLSFAVFV